MTKKASGKVERATRRVQSVNDEPSLTQQQFKASVDPATIVRHYAQTGLDPYESRKQQMRYGNATSKSFTEAMYQVAEVQSAFQALPAQVRQAYSNDPGRWLSDLEREAQGADEIDAPAASQEPSDPDRETATDRPENADLNTT